VDTRIKPPHRLHREQELPLPLEEVFPFFANAENLEAITPPGVGFRILSALPIEMRQGALIDYQIRLHGFPLRWRTEITAWEPPHRFVDEQLRGPYALWRHTHRFEAIPGGTRVTDEVEYAIPFEWMPGSSLLLRYFVQPELDRIFDFRRKALLQHFRLPIP
jgi:ligand-binding SRPBCC domain-containing protein